MVPTKATVAPVLSLVRIMALLAGAWILSRVIDMHDATAGEIWDHAVQWHGVVVVVLSLIEVVMTDPVLETKVVSAHGFLTSLKEITCS